MISAAHMLGSIRGHVPPKRKLEKNDAICFSFFVVYFDLILSSKIFNISCQKT